MRSSKNSQNTSNKPFDNQTETSITCTPLIKASLHSTSRSVFSKRTLVSSFVKRSQFQQGSWKIALYGEVWTQDHFKAFQFQNQCDIIPLNKTEFRKGLKRIPLNLNDYHKAIFLKKMQHTSRRVLLYLFLGLILKLTLILKIKIDPCFLSIHCLCLVSLAVQ